MYGYSQDPLRLSSARHGPRSAAHFLAVAHAALSGAVRWIERSWLAKALAAVTAERRTRNAILELRRWDDHMLRDVGLERMEIESAIRGEHRQSHQWEPDCDPAERRRLENLH